ncbi:MAG: HEAT repeat domain-containing protein [Polyangiaceae bacterium]|jgi:HEAT repeat protein|nr:HEAT repeat domain-containing protein [Polyangiaceae bacterium]MBK8942245.1 HEAT repeat domain-containing protein [Polyangiaceae bacterium]
MFYAPLPRTLEAALRDITDRKVQVRVSASKDLVAHVAADRAKVVSALEKALGDSNGLVRASAAEGLGAVEGKEALSALLVAVEDEHQIVRQTALQALGEIGDARAQQRLERALKDARPEVRFQAVMAYPRVASSREDAMAALAEATRDDDDSVAHIAFRMAEELSEDARGVVADAILARAERCLTHASAKVRGVAAVVLATAGRPECDPLLREMIDGKLPDAEPEDVAAAIELAGARGLQDVVPALRRRAFGGLLRRDPFQWQARVALARLGDARAKSEILAELGAGSFERRTLAVSAAGRARLSEARGLLLAMRDQPERAEPSAVDAALSLLDGGAT